MAWGGKREGAGRKKVATAPRARPAPKLRATPLLAPAEPKKPDGLDARVLAEMLPQLAELSRANARQRPRTRELCPFVLPKFPAHLEPPADKGGGMAMDSALVQNLDACATDWLGGGTPYGVGDQGLQFLGYPYLAELAQRPEFRVMAETIADDATRKWIDFDVTGDEKQRREAAARDPEGHAERMADPDERRKRVAAAGKADKVKALKDDQLRLGVKERFYEQSRNDSFFGRSHLYLDVWTTGSEPDADELKTPIGDGRDATSVSKVPRGSFRALRTVEPMWTYPQLYNALNPIRPDWYNPQQWYVIGQEIHVSRMQPFVGHPVPDMLKPAYAFGGLSLTQMAKPYVDIWLRTKQSVADLIHSFSVMVLMTDLQTLMNPGSAAGLIARAVMFNMLRDNQGLFLANKSTEDFKNVSASLAGLHELQAQSQEHCAAVHRIPLVKFTGIQPAGLNASSEGEIKVYDDTIGAYQFRFFDPQLTRVINFQQLSLWGEIDPEITHRFEPLREMTQAEKGQKEKDDADRNQKYVDMGAIAPGEVRQVIINDKDLPYTGLDPDDVPEPPDDGEGDGEPGDDEHGPQDRGEEHHRGGAANDVDIDEEGDELRDLIESLGRLPPSRETDRAIKRARTRLIRVVAMSTPAGGDPGEGEGGGASDAAIPFAGDEAPFEEGKHPRDQDGKFSTGGGAAAKKKTAFGGLYKETGKGPEANHKATVDFVLSKPPNAGSSYRQLLAKLIQEAPKLGDASKVPALKAHLVQALTTVREQLLKKALETSNDVESKTLLAMAENAKKKAMELGWVPPQNHQPQPAAHPVAPPPKADTKAAIQKAQLIEKLKQNTGGLGESGQTPLNVGKEIVKAAVQLDLPMAVAEAVMSAPQKDAMKKQYGSVEAAYLKGQNYAAAEKQNKALQLQAKHQEEEQEKAFYESINSPEAKAHAAALAGILSGAQSAQKAIEHAAAKLKSASAGLRKALNPAEAAQIIAYSGSYYRAVNQQLRQGVMTEEQWNFAKSLNAALDKCPKHTAGPTRRGTTLTPDHLAQYKPGMIIEERGFTSTSSGSGFSGNVTYEVYGKTGVDISTLSQHPGEKEIVFKAGARFRIKSKNGNKIVLEEV